MNFYPLLLFRKLNCGLIRWWRQCPFRLSSYPIEHLKSIYITLFLTHTNYLDIVKTISQSHQVRFKGTQEFYLPPIIGFKGHSHEIFCFMLFSGIMFPKVPEKKWGSFRIYLKICGDICMSLCSTGINDTSGKFATGVNDTSNELAAGVNYRGGK